MSLLNLDELLDLFRNQQKANNYYIYAELLQKVTESLEQARNDHRHIGLENAALEDKNRELLRQLTEQEQTIGQQHDNLEKSTAEYSKLIEEYSGLYGRAAARFRKICELNEKLSDAKQHEIDLRAEIVQLKSENEDHQAANAQLDADHADLVQKIETLEASLFAEQVRSAQLTEERDSLAERLQIDNESLETQLRATINALATERARNDQLLRERDELSKQLESASQSVHEDSSRPAKRRRLNDSGNTSDSSALQIDENFPLSEHHAIDQCLRPIDSAIHSTNNAAARAQLFLLKAKMCFNVGRFTEALGAVNEALLIESTCEEALHLRIQINHELQDNPEIRNDMKRILQQDPLNFPALDRMRTINPAPRCSDRFYKTFLAHSLRRAIINAKINSNGVVMPDSTTFLPKLTFISRRSALAMGQLLENSAVLEVGAQSSADRSERREPSLALMLPTRLAIHRFLTEHYSANMLLVPICNQFTRIFLELASPPDIALHFRTKHWDVEFASKFTSVVYYQDFSTRQFNNIAMNAIKEYAPVLTRLLYHFEITSWKDSSLPRLDTIVVPADTVSESFIKLWHKKKWPVKRLIFTDMPKLIRFKPPNGSSMISDKLTDVCIRFGDPYQTLEDPNQPLDAKELRNRLETLKEVFPNLSSVTCLFTSSDKLGSSQTNFNTADDSYYNCSTAVDRVFKSIITKMYGQVEPDWCRPLIFIEFVVTFKELGLIQVGFMNILKGLLDQWRAQYDVLSHSRLTGPCIAEHDLSIKNACYAVLDLEIDERLRVQMAFKPAAK